MSGRIEDSVMEKDMNEVEKRNSMTKATRQTFDSFRRNALSVTGENISAFEKNPLTGAPLVSEYNKLKYREAIAYMILDAYGAKAWEFHNEITVTPEQERFKIDVKQKYDMSDEHYRFIVQHINIPSAIAEHTLKCKGTGVKSDGTVSATFDSSPLLDQVTPVLVDDKQSDIIYAGMLEQTIARLTLEKRTASKESLPDIEISINTLNATLSSLKNKGAEQSV